MDINSLDIESSVYLCAERKLQTLKTAEVAIDHQVVISAEWGIQQPCTITSVEGFHVLENSPGTGRLQHFLY